MDVLTNLEYDEEMKFYFSGINVVSIWCWVRFMIYNPSSHILYAECEPWGIDRCGGFAAVECLAPQLLNSPIAVPCTETWNLTTPHLNRELSSFGPPALTGFQAPSFQVPDYQLQVSVNTKHSPEQETYRQPR
jgi:hypothetical protein